MLSHTNFQNVDTAIFSFSTEYVLTDGNHKTKSFCQSVQKKREEKKGNYKVFCVTFIIVLYNFIVEEIGDTIKTNMLTNEDEKRI